MGSRRTRNKSYFFLPLLLLVTGCVNTGVTTGSLAAVAPTSSRLIIFRPSTFVEGGAAPTIKINDVASCVLENGKGFEKDMTPGDVTISAGVWNMLGTSKLSFTAAAGQTYYVQVSPNDGEVFAGAALGLLGQALDQASSYDSGPFDIIQAGKFDLGSITPGICTI